MGPICVRVRKAPYQILATTSVLFLDGSQCGPRLDRSPLVPLMPGYDPTGRTRCLAPLSPLMNPLQQQLEASLAGRYDIEREIGAGGMATVYLASDIRHHRKVAVKVLNPELGAVLGAERFLAEIRVTANLQHPNLLPLFDSGEASGLLFYVMPYVEGETLRHRLDREKQLPIDEAVRIATAIASALDYAHRHGVIHRDLKPENILLQEGQPLIADFGIALAVSNAGGARVTQTGLSLGTPQYMSPEQATGDRGVDGRTDIYSLGALTYEMLAGEPPHTGTSAQAIIAKLITEEPRPISAQRRSVPEHVEGAVECALQKLPADRFATAREFADALNGRGSPHAATTSHAKRAAAKRRTSPAVMAAVAGIAGAVGAFAAWSLRPARATRAVEFQLTATGPTSYAPLGGRSVAFSPDGAAVAYLAVGQGNGGIVIRRLDTAQPQPLPGTDGAQDLSHSPDGKRIAFYRNGKLFTVATDGSPPVELMMIGSWNGITWVNDKTIVYEVADTLWAVDVATTTKRVVTVANEAAGEGGINTPIGMPDGETVAFNVTDVEAAGGTNRLAFIALDGSKRVVTQIVSRMAFAHLDGWLLHAAATGGGVMAVQFDLSGRKSTGEIVRLADTTLIPSAFATSISAHGDIVYVTGTRSRKIAVLGARGEEITSLADLDLFNYPTWSPDGQRVAYSVPIPGVRGQTGISIFDVKSGTTARLTTSVSASRPAWSPDGKRIAFIGLGAPTQSVHVIPSDGSATDSVLYTAPNSTVREVAFAPDGRSLLLTINSTTAPTKRDIVLVPFGGSKVVPLLSTTADEKQPALSFDGRWLAYMSDGSGRSEVYVRPMNGAAGSAMISKGGGSSPRWTRDGRIVYVDGPASLRRVELTTVGGLPAVGKRDSLFTPRAIRNEVHQTYDLSADGRFVFVRNATTDAEVVVVTDWWRRHLARLQGR